jgi:serine/threonine protein kinase
MLRSVEAIVDEEGNVRLMEPVTLRGPRRAIVTILDEPPATVTIPPTLEPGAAGPVAVDETIGAGAWRAHYEPVRVLGRGGMGETYQARERLTGKVVCVKQLLPEIDPRSLLQECRALARLDHPGIVRLRDFDTAAVPPYLVMDYVDGPTLADYLRHHRVVPEPVASGLGLGIFDALAFAHEREVLHCDLKPGNILLELRGTSVAPKVLDFGLAVVDRRDDHDCPTAEGRFAGTPSYMAPEQVRGELLGGACDVYAAGQVLWEMVMGRPAFPVAGGNVMATAYEKVERAGGLAVHGPPLGVSDALADLIGRCTHPRPDRRPGASEAREALRALAGADAGPAVLAPLNLRFDLPSGGEEMPAGWCDSLGFVDGASPAYKATAEGSSCLRLRSEGARKGEFGSLMQRIPARHLAGRAVRLEGRIRAECEDGWAGLWLRADDESQVLVFDNMADRRVRGSSPWTACAIEAELPRGVVWLNYGLLLVGRGAAWVSDLRLAALGADGGAPLPLSLWDGHSYRSGGRAWAEGETNLT